MSHHSLYFLDIIQLRIHQDISNPKSICRVLPSLWFLSLIVNHGFKILKEKNREIKIQDSVVKYCAFLPYPSLDANHSFVQLLILLFSIPHSFYILPTRQSHSRRSVSTIGSFRHLLGGPETYLMRVRRKSCILTYGPESWEQEKFSKIKSNNLVSHKVAHRKNKCVGYNDICFWSDTFFIFFIINQ